MTRQYIMQNQKNPKTFLSWGKSLQSTTLGVMAVKGLFKLDGIITADTHWEHSYTNEIEKYYTEYFQQNGIPVYVVSGGNIKLESVDKPEIPYFTSPSGAPLRRQCTNEYKIQPCRRKIRELLGARPEGWGRIRKGSAKLLLGISYDEAERMKDSTASYIINEFPLVDMKFTRKLCVEYLENLGLPVPRKSSCICCPYQGAERWWDLKQNFPQDWADVVEFDNLHRNPPEQMLKRGHDCKLYLWKKLNPLEEVDWTSILEKSDEKDICDSGYCFV